jgi:predicted HicB family RNase H-like nuclease
MTTTNEPLVALLTRIPKALHKRAKVAALQADIDLQDLVEQALGEWLIRHG